MILSSHAYRRRAVRGVLLAGVGLLALWLGSSVLSLLSAGADLRRGTQQLSSLDEVLTVDAATRGLTGPGLRSVAAPFQAGEAELDDPLLGPLRLFPILGRQIRTADALAGSVAQVLNGAAQVADTIDAVDATQPAGRVEGIRRVQTSLATFSEISRRADLGDGAGLVGSLAESRQSARTRLDELDRAVAEGSVFLDAAARLFQPNQRILVLGATNAEMRVGQGAVTQFGILSFEAGSLDFTRPMSRAALARPASPIPVKDPDTLRNWSFLDTQNLAYIGTTPRFDVVAERAAALVEAATGERFALVVQVDAVALTRLASLTGPLTVEGAASPLEGDALLRFLLHDQYVAIPNLRGGPENSQRREALSRVASTVVEQLGKGDLPLGRLAEETRRLGVGRNLLVHALDPALAPGVRALGMEGTVPADVLAFGLLHAGASKLDQFVGVRVDLDLQPKGDRTLVTARVSVRNQTPVDEPPYIRGEQPVGTPPQGYAAFVVVTVPGAATNLVPPPGEALFVNGTDGPAQVMGTYIRLARGQRADMVFTFEVPKGSSLSVLPSTRVPGVGWYLGERRLGDDEPHRVQA